MIKNLFSRSLNADKDKVNVGRNVSGLEAKVDVNDKNVHIIVVLKDEQHEIGAGYFNTFPSNRDMRDIKNSYEKLVSLVSNGKYSVERDDKGIFIRFPDFYEDQDDSMHGREYKIWIR